MEDSLMDYSMIEYEGKTGLVGSGSDMPIDYLLRKQEQTCMYESPDQVEDFHRSTLRDMKPLKPLFESDQPRGGTDERGTPFGNNISERFISFRDTGFQNEQDAEPNLPDGSFYDWQFLEQDPRGVATDPDMKKHASQQFARGSFYNYRPDSDDSIPESGINPWVMNSNIRQAQNVTKDYFKIFKTSFDAWTNGGMAPGYAVSNKEKIYDDQEIKDPAQNPNRNRMDVTNNLSNDTSIGWRRTTDHRFEVERYGKTSVGKPFTNEDWYKNRSNSNTDHDTLVRHQDVNISKATALLMMDLAKQKFDAHYTGLQGINWSDSKKSKSTKSRLAPADMSGMAKRPYIASQGLSDHTKLNGEQAPTAGEKMLLHDIQNIGKTDIKTTIYEKMGQATRKSNKETKSDLRNSIEQTAKRDLFTIESQNKEKHKPNFALNKLWESIPIFKKGEEKQIVNYTTAKKTIEGHNLERLSMPDFKDDSKYNTQRRGRLNKSIIHKFNETIQDNKFGKEGVHTKSTGGMQGKYMTPYMETDTQNHDINDR